MTLRTWRPRQTIALLLLVAAGLFIIGVSAEPGEDSHDEPAAQATEHNEANETAETRETEAADGENEEAAEDGERVLGIDLESPLPVVAAVGVSLLLAGLVWRRPDRRLLMIIAAFAVVFAALDVAEVAHQLNEDRTGLALLAGVIAALHAATALLALQQTTTTPAGRDTLTA